MILACILCFTLFLLYIYACKIIDNKALTRVLDRYTAVVKSKGFIHIPYGSDRKYNARQDSDVLQHTGTIFPAAMIQKNENKITRTPGAGVYGRCKRRYRGPSITAVSGTRVPGINHECVMRDPNRVLLVKILVSTLRVLRGPD